MKRTAVLIATALLALGMGACGGGDSSSSGAAGGTSESTAKPAGGAGTGSSPKQRSDQVKSSARPGQSDSGSPGGQSRGGGAEGGSGGGAASKEGGAGKRFVPKRHNDSAGGAAQFQVKGGDNSIQEFGSEAGGSEFGEIATAFHNFLDARSQGDWTAACGYLSSSLAQSLEQLAARAEQSGDTSCAAALSKLTNPAAMDQLRSEAAQADVGSVRVEGDRGFVVYTAAGTVFAISMTKEAGGWKVGGLAGVPLS